MLGESANWPDRMLFSHWNKKVSVRTQRYRLDQTGKLYDMQKDPGQREDVAQQHPDVTARLKAAVNKWSDELLPNLTDDQRSFPVGHHDVAWTHLPARDGVPHGKIQRSSKHPNSTFFMNWVSSEDQVTWDVEVLTSGKYQVELYYACPETSIGTEFELEFNGQKLKGRVEQPNDVPLRGAEHDRITRTEGYIKDFKPMRLGVITLPAGRGELTLRAPTIKGAQAPEIRMLSLYRE